MKSKNRVIEEEDVIELWKLCLYEDHATSKISRRVHAQLLKAGRTLDKLLTTHFRAIVRYAKEQIKGEALADFTAEEIDDMPTQVFFSVPQMWQAPGNRRSELCLHPTDTDVPPARIFLARRSRARHPVRSFVGLGVLFPTEE